MAVRKLRIQEPDKAPREIDLAPGLTIGRSATNRLVLADSSASGNHARIVEIDGALAIQDVGSANKTRIEGGPALAKDQHARLVPGMCVTIGGTKIEFVGEDDDDAGATMQRAAAGRSEDETDMRTLVRPEPAKPPAPSPSKPRVAGDVQEDLTLPRARPDAAPPAKPAPSAPSASKSAPGPKSAPLVPATSPGADAEDDLGPDDVELTAPVGAPEFEPALMQATLGEAKPRLVFRTKKQGVVAAVTDAVQVIGRKKVGDVTIALDDDGVSSRHARLTLSGRTFWIEDLESKNHTHLDKEQIAPKVKRALHGDCWLRFGTVDALFVTENVAGMESPDARTYAEAIEYLAESGALAGETLKSAKATLGKGAHPAQDLIVSGAISVAQWHEAITTAKLRVRANVPRSKGGSQKMLVGALVVVVLILVVVVVWLMQSGK